MNPIVDDLPDLPVIAKINVTSPSGELYGVVELTADHFQHGGRYHHVGELVFAELPDAVWKRGLADARG